MSTPSPNAVIHLFRYYRPQALCGERRNQEDATRDRVDRVPTTMPTCMTCIALRHDDCDVLFAYPAAESATSRCYVTKDGVAHAPTSAPEFGQVFRLCDRNARHNEIVYSMDAKHLKEVPVTCLECLIYLAEGE